MRKKIFGLPIVIFVLCLVILGGASAALVTYLSNTISAGISVESPVVLNDGEASFSMDLGHGGEYDLILVKIENTASVPAYGSFDVGFDDTSGFHTAISEDINYCFKDQGDMTSVADCEVDYEQWVINNPDWMDWYADTDYDALLFEASYVINHGGDSFHSLGGYVGGVLSLPISSDSPLDPESVIYGVVYIDTELSVAPGSYNIDILFSS